MCDITPPRGFIVLLLGEAKAESDIEFLSKGLEVVYEKLCRIISRTTRPIYLSFIPQDLSPYNLDDPIALSWELVSENDECRSHLCEKLNKCDELENQAIDPLTLSDMTGMFHGLLEKSIDKPGSDMLLDVILIISEPGVSQLREGDEALELYGALRRVRWQSGCVTAVYSLSACKDLLISCVVNTSVVLTEDEKLNCIDENVWWRGVYLPVFNPFDATNREKQMVDLSISINYELQEEKKEKKKKTSKRKNPEENEFLKSEFHLMILVMKEVVTARFPLFILDSKYLNLYSSDEKGARALMDLTARLTSGEVEGRPETSGVLYLVPCCLEKTLTTDTWYEYIIGKQSHWINSVKVKLLHTPNYCVPFQRPSNGVFHIWRYREKLDLPEQVLEEYLKSKTEDVGVEEEPSEPIDDIFLPELNVEHISVIHSVWNELLRLPPQSESGETNEEFQNRIDDIVKPLHSLSPAPKVLIKKSTDDAPPEESKYPEDVTETDEYKALCGLDLYFNWSKEQQSSNLKSLGGFSPPPMTHNKDKIGVDSLLKCFDQEGHPIDELEPVSIPSKPKRKDIRTRLFENATETEDRDSFFEYSWENTQKNLVKNETRGLMNYESPPKSPIYYKSSLSQGPSSSRSHSLKETNSSSLKTKSTKNEVKCSLSKNNTKKLTPKNHLKTKVRNKHSKGSKDTKLKSKTDSESTGDRQLRSLLERSVVKALQGEQLNRDHPQFKPAYTQLFNVCKCFLSGLEVEAAIEKVEQLAISNAKQVIELQVKK